MGACGVWVVVEWNSEWDDDGINSICGPFPYEHFANDAMQLLDDKPRNTFRYEVVDLNNM